jgi:hypothetical protein
VMRQLLLGLAADGARARGDPELARQLLMG